MIRMPPFARFFLLDLRSPSSITLTPKDIACCHGNATTVTLARDLYSFLSLQFSMLVCFQNAPGTIIISFQNIREKLEEEKKNTAMKINMSILLWGFLPFRCPPIFHKPSKPTRCLKYYHVSHSRTLFCPHSTFVFFL